MIHRRASLFPRDVRLRGLRIGTNLIVRVRLRLRVRVRVRVRMSTNLMDL